MSDSVSPATKAERLGARRARMFPVLAVFYLAQQVTYFSADKPTPVRTVDTVHVAAWLVLSVVLIAALMSGGAWLHGREVRALLNDEGTRAHRDSALRWGFLATMLTGVATFFLAQIEPVSGIEAVHLMMSIGIAAALVRFGMLERRALQDG